MKNLLTFLLFFSVSNAYFSTQLFSTNPNLSKWITNLSEEEGYETGYDDLNQEVYIDGNSVHTMWLTNGDEDVLYYRKSSDGGDSWEAPIRVFSASNGIDLRKNARRMYVYNNVVHFAIVKSNTWGDTHLLYIKSDDGGQSFTEPDTLFAPNYWYLDYAQISGDGPNINIGVIHGCDGCGGPQTPHIFNSTDNGENFVQRTLPPEFTGGEFFHWDLITQENNLYFSYKRTVINYSAYEYHLVSSNDGGVNFKDNLVSIPDGDGNHHSFWFDFDTGWGYIQKISADDNTVAVVWSGLNENNQNSIFTAVSMDYGQHFEATKTIVANIPNLQYGQYTLMVNQNNVFIAFLTSDSKIHGAISNDSGANFGEVFEITNPNGSINKSWGPNLVKDNSGTGVYVLAAGPSFGYLNESGLERNLAFIGNFSVASLNSNCAVSSTGDLHFLYPAGNAYLGGSGNQFSDYDIFYRKISKNDFNEGSSNQCLNFDFISNQNDGTGFEQLDNTTIRSSSSLNFTQALTIELMVKPKKGNDGELILTQSIGGQFPTPWDPSSIQLWLNPNNHKELLAGIFTETGGYILNSLNPIREEFWNHISISYEDSGEANNFKIYINGKLDNQTTASGQLKTEGINWYLGQRVDIGVSGETGFQGQMDEFRLWNVALSQEQIQENILAEIEDEEQLVCYLNFNGINAHGQVKDFSGNDNHGILMYQETLETSSIKDINARFSYRQNTNDFFFTPEAESLDSSVWDFGDGILSSQVHAFHEYASPGVYEVCFTAFYDDNYGSYCEQVSIDGIKDFTPKQGGNLGSVTMRITGGSLTDQSIVHLSKSGETNIESYYTAFIAPDQLYVVFDLFEKPIGKWDIIVTNNDEPLTLSTPFTIVEGVGADPWVNISTPKRTRPYRWEDVVISVGNNGDADALLTPLHIFIPDPYDEMEVDFIGFNQTTMVGMEELNIDSSGVIEDFIELDSLFDEPNKGKLYVYLVPSIPVGEVISTKFRVKTPESILLQAWVSSPLLSADVSDEKDPNKLAKTVVCLSNLALSVGTDLAGLDDAAECITNTYNLILKETAEYGLRQKTGEKFDVWGFVYSASWIAVDCGMKLTKKTNPWYKVYDFITSKSKYFEWAKDFVGCFKDFLPDEISKSKLFTFSAFDPNEILGPEGFGDNNYIKESSSLNYTITYENKADASAPAAEVTIFDTLDTEVFDIAKFEVGAFGFGDSLYIPGAGLKSYTRDIDLGAQVDYVVRFNSEISEEGIIEFRLTTLMKDSMVIPSDPLIGFLPPNVTSPEGEGFVSYTIGVKKGIEHDAVLSNQAAIIFDFNKPIFTNIHEVRFDLTAPESELYSDDLEVQDTIAYMDVISSDDGAGIKYFKIFSSTDDSSFILSEYLPGDDDEYEYEGEVGSSYKFYSVAVDSVDNEEIHAASPDVILDFTSQINEIEPLIAEAVIYPQPCNDQLHIRLTLREKMDVQLVIYDIMGKLKTRFSPKNLSAGTHILQAKSASWDPGIYFVEFYVRGRKFTQKIIKQ